MRRPRENQPENARISRDESSPRWGLFWARESPRQASPSRHGRPRQHPKGVGLSRPSESPATMTWHRCGERRRSGDGEQEAHHVKATSRHVTPRHVNPSGPLNFGFSAPTALLLALKSDANRRGQRSRAVRRATYAYSIVRKAPKRHPKGGSGGIRRLHPKGPKRGSAAGGA